MRISKSLLSDVTVLWRFRRRLAASVIEDVRHRYAGSIFGTAWAVLYPLCLLGIYTIVYLVIFRIRPPSLDEYGYVVLVFSGLVPLLSFSESLTASTGSLVANRNLLLNTVFPAELIPLRAALAGQVPALFGLAITLILAFVFGRATLVTLIAVPLLWVMLVAFVAGLGWMLSLVTLVVRDIQQFLALIIMLLFVLSPAAYTPEMVPPGLKAVLYANPLSYFVLSFQHAICYGRWPDPFVWVVSASLASLTFAFGFFFFRRAKFVFFDYA